MEISIPGRYFFDCLSGIAWGDLLRNRNGMEMLFLQQQPVGDLLCIYCRVCGGFSEGVSDSRVTGYIPFKSFAYTVKKRLRGLGSEGLYRGPCS